MDIFSSFERQPTGQKQHQREWQNMAIELPTHMAGKFCRGGYGLTRDEADIWLDHFFGHGPFHSLPVNCGSLLFLDSIEYASEVPIGIEFDKPWISQ